MRRMVVLLFSFVLLVSVFAPVSFAADSKEPAKDESNVLGIYNGQKIVDVKKFVDGELVDATFEEYVNEMEQSQNNINAAKAREQQLMQPQEQDTAAALLPVVIVNYYNQTYSYYYYAAPERASATIGCPSQLISCTIGVQYGITKNSSFSANLSFDKKSAIKAALGYTYTDSATVSNTYTFTFAPGQTGYVAFSPKYYHSEGNVDAYLQDSVGNLTFLDSTFGSTETPQRLSSGFLDGYVTAVLE